MTDKKLKSKYCWENDEIHAGYAYNGSTWKKIQLDFLFDFIHEHMSLSSSLRCLDIGCNAALNLVEVKKRYTDYDHSYYGFDINETALSIARDNLPEGKFLKSNFLLENPLSSFDDDFFDVCFSTWILSHLNVTKQREDLISDMVRVSKRGIIYEAAKAINSPNWERKIAGTRKHNIVVYDDYTKYSDLIIFHKEMPRESSALFYWDKTRQEREK